ncbi:beta-1,3-galactosyltransferase 2-like [Pseudorasbora parva]|uniref:beta-1,3-galactosyltransferase 2-like n=1 Tax=Pseudorasbora parva TaxID=51549 RepID=UPI00351E2A22
MMRWKRKSRYCKVALFLLLLVVVGSFIIQGQQQPCQIYQDGFATQWLQTLKTFNSTLYPNRLRELKVAPTLISNENVISASDVLKISSSEEMRDERSLKVEPYEYILNEPNACLLQAPFLVLLIAVEPKKSEARDAIRKTWGNESMAGDLGFIRLFFLGVNDDTERKKIEDESRQHHDIIQQDYMDTYNNLTLKTLMGMYWITKYCPEAKYVMKTDTDMFVNTEYLIQKLLKPKGQHTKNYFTGYIMSGFSPVRYKDSKWYMSPEEYSCSYYPIFCSGTGYVFSGDVAQRVYVASLIIPRIHLEDVYVGICLAKLKIVPEATPNDLFNNWRVPYSRCKYSNLITSHGLQPNEMIQYWQDIESNKQSLQNDGIKGLINRLSCFFWGRGSFFFST